MNIAKIVSITPAGKAWTPSQGDGSPLFPFTVAFDDGRAGGANAKTNPPAYRVGEVAGYDVTGQTPRGVDKFKITRNPDMARGTYTGRPDQDDSNPDLEAYTPRPFDQQRKVPNAHQSPRQSSQNRPPEPPVGELKVNLPHPACVGACVNKAVEVWIATIGKDQPWGDSSADTVHMIASELIAVHFKLEQGEMWGNTPF